MVQRGLHFVERTRLASPSFTEASRKNTISGISAVSVLRPFPFILNVLSHRFISRYDVTFRLIRTSFLPLFFFSLSLEGQAPRITREFLVQKGDFFSRVTRNVNFSHLGSIKRAHVSIIQKLRAGISSRRVRRGELMEKPRLM